MVPTCCEIRLAIGVGNAFRLVDGNPQELVLAAAFQFHFDDLDAFGLGDALGDLLDFRMQPCLPHVTNAIQQKSGLSPTGLVRHSKLHFSADVGKSGKWL